MLSLEDWAEIRRLHRAEGLSIKEIVRRTGAARNTVRAALRSDRPPAYERATTGSIVDRYDRDIRKLLKDHPRMPATVIAERIGWDRGMTVLKQRVRELRPIYLPPDACGRTEYRPGELAQWDLWFPPARIPLGAGHVGRPPVLVGVSGYSRWLVARMIPSREAHDVLCGHLALLQELGGVPRLGVYDGEPALAHRRRGRAVLTPAFQAFRGTLGMGVVICKPADPEAKGLVERANQFLETSFLPGRDFEGPDDFNAQLGEWLTRANARVHSTLRCRPTERIAEDRAAMMAFPPVAPDPALRFAVRLPRDHWVRVGTCDYSVHPRAVGRRVEVRADLEEVVARMGTVVVARHRRSWAPHRTITDPAHDAARKIMAAFRATVVDDDEADVEVRDLAAYDRALRVVL